jgi:hypothetical protein
MPATLAPPLSQSGYFECAKRADERDLGKERERLLGLIDKFAAGGAAGCTKNPHSFFGKMTPEEWAILMYKHLDHHLRQFGV